MGTIGHVAEPFADCKFPTFFCDINPRICFKLFHTFHKSAFCWTAGLLPTEVRKLHDFLIHGWIPKMMYIVV